MLAHLSTPEAVLIEMYIMDKLHCIPSSTTHANIINTWHILCNDDKKKTHK